MLLVVANAWPVFTDGNFFFSQNWVLYDTWHNSKDSWPAKSTLLICHFGYHKALNCPPLVILWRGIVLGWKWRRYLWRCSVVRICNLDGANSSSKTFFFFVFICLLLRLLLNCFIRSDILWLLWYFLQGTKKKLSFSDLSLCFDHVSTQTSFFSCLLTRFLVFPFVDNCAKMTWFSAICVSPRNKF